MSMRDRLEQLRAWMDRAFDADTASGSWNPDVPSSGHCAVAAAIVQRSFGGQFVSAVVNGQSHWFNRFDDLGLDIDLTGDQFGRERVQVAFTGKLYRGTRVRQPSELNDETKARLERFAVRLDSVRRA